MTTHRCGHLRSAYSMTCRPLSTCSMPACSRRTERRIGAEQEMFLVDSAMRPAGLAVEVIEAAPTGV